MNMLMLRSTYVPEDKEEVQTKERGEGENVGLQSGHYTFFVNQTDLPWKGSEGRGEIEKEREKASNFILFYF